jgi:hypothetical protein
MSNDRAPRVPDLISDSELLTSIIDGVTKHVMDEIGVSSRRRRVQWEQHWARKKYLGRGAYGSVWLEECVTGVRDIQVRAVKQILKDRQQSQQIAYHRELEAIMKFSNPKVSLLFSAQDLKCYHS